MTAKKIAKKKASKKKAAKKTGRKARVTVDWSGLPQSTTQFAELLGVAPGRVSEWIKEGMPAVGGGVRGATTNIYVHQALPWLIPRLRSGYEAEGEQERLAAAKADHQEMVNAEKRQDLVYAHQVAVTFSNAISTLKKTSLSFSSRVSNIVASMDNPAEVREYLLEEVRAFWLDFREELEQLTEEGVTLSSDPDDDD